LRSLDERLLQLGSRTQALHADMANLRVADIAAARSRDTEYLRISTEEFNVGCWRASRSRMKVEGNERDVRPFALRSRLRSKVAQATGIGSPKQRRRIRVQYDAAEAHLISFSGARNFSMLIASLPNARMLTGFTDELSLFYFLGQYER
jgi:hypothetical protein